MQRAVRRRVLCHGLVGLGIAPNIARVPVAGLLAQGLVAATPARARAAGASTPAPDAHQVFVQQAFEMRRRAIERGDQPYGAVVVKDGRIAGEGISAVITSQDPTAHAEMVAIRAASIVLRSTDLSGCVLYGSARACAMCESAAYRARISRMVYGEAAQDAGAPRLR